MAKLWRQLVAFYDSRTASEQRTLAIGAPLILCLVIFLLVVNPLWEQYRSLSGYNKALRGDLTWLLSQHDYLSRINSPCSMPADTLDEAGAEAVIEARARRLGLSPSVRAEGGDPLFVVALQSAAGNMVLDLLRDLSCQGLVLERFDIQTVDTENDLVNAEMDLILP